MKKKGFTLIELLGVIVILGIVLGLVVLAYVNNQGSVNVTYYKALEESLLIPGGDYFNYNKGMQPSVFGDEKKVNIQTLKDNGYIDEEIVGSDKKPCDLNNSYVGAYKDSKDKTNYYVCLVCGEYENKEAPCGGKVSYSLGVRANKKNSKDTYSLDGVSWSDENIVLTFETLNDMEEVILKDENDKQVGSCGLNSNKNIKSCTITVTKSGKYKAYAKNNKATTKENDIPILIDKTPPTFDFQNKGNNEKIEVAVDNNKVEKVIQNKVYNIKDSESGIKSVEYSLEHENYKDNYHDEGIVTSFDIEKKLKMGKNYLKVRVKNNAGLVTEKVIIYQVYKKIVDPTEGSYCNNLIYNGGEQTLVNDPGEGYTFEYKTGTDAKDYKIGILLKENYRFTDGTTTPRSIVCKIQPKKIRITAKPQTIEYNGEIVKSLDMVTASGLISGETLTSINMVKKIVNGGSKIIPSNAIIKRNTTNVTANYDIIYQTGKLTINPKITISISGTVEQSGYQNGAQATVQCESVDDITSFVVTSDTGATTTLSGGTKKSSVVTLDTNGKNRTVKGACKAGDGSSEQSSNYNIYVYSQDNSCSCKTAKTCEKSCCGTYKCNCNKPCIEYTTDCVVGGNSTTTTGSSCKPCGGNRTCTCTKRGAEKCSTCNSSCTNESCCGCKTRNSCWHL